MGSFQYEWWTVDIRSETGRLTWEFKGKNKDSVIKQIEREIKRRDSEKNLAKDCWHREARILEVYWDTLTLDRTGYQRLG